MGRNERNGKRRKRKMRNTTRRKDRWRNREGGRWRTEDHIGREKGEERQNESPGRGRKGGKRRVEESKKMIEREAVCLLS